MKIFKSLGHFVASVLLAVVHAAAGLGSPATDSAAMSVATGVANLLSLFTIIPNAPAVLKAAMAVLGDVVAALRAAGQEAGSGAGLPVIISDAALIAVKEILPDVEKVIQAFEGTGGSATPPPLAASAAIANSQAA